MNLHLAYKGSVAPIIKAWGENQLVKEKYIEFTPGGKERYDKLMTQINECVENIKRKHSIKRNSTV